MKKKLQQITGIALLLGTASFLNAQDAIKRLNHDEATKMALSKSQPDYPAMGKQLKLEGTVQVEANIEENGSVESVKVVSGNIVLANAAVTATKRWKFPPITMDGKPAKGVATLRFTFKL